MAEEIIPRKNTARNNLSAECVRSLLDYNPETGIFTWKYRPWLTGKATAWNIRYAGSIAGRKGGHRRIEIAIERRLYIAPRIAWLYMTGEWPKEEIDHIDGNYINNKFKNLREATRFQNAKNTKITTRNICGFKGVSVKRKARGNIYVSRIRVDNTVHYLGSFKSPEEAYAAYCEASKKFHRDFSRLK